MTQAPESLPALEPVAFFPPDARLGVVCAMHEELSEVVSLLGGQARRVGGRDFWQASWHGVEVVAVLCRIGKVAAATTVSTLIHRFGITHVVFSGVAGGLARGVQVGDVVVARHFVQHDMDASPLFARFEVPLYGQSLFACDDFLSLALAQAAQQCLATLGEQGQDSGFLAGLNLKPQAWTLHQGLIASGDQFIASNLQRQAILTALPDVLAVEMEGAAVAQVCHDFGLPFAAVRIISDQADETAHVDFAQFIAQVAAPFGAAILQALVQSLARHAGAGDPPPHGVSIDHA
jgi:adenosylhomocysteine nucleosidase